MTDTQQKKDGPTPDLVERLRAKLAECESECLEQARLNGMGAERELKLLARAEAAEKRLAEAGKVIAPFAAVAEWDIGDSEDAEDVFWPMSNARYSVAGRLRVGHLRAAAKWMEKNR